MNLSAIVDVMLPLYIPAGAYQVLVGQLSTQQANTTLSRGKIGISCLFKHKDHKAESALPL